MKGYHLKFDKVIDLVPYEWKEKMRKTEMYFLPGIHQDSNKYRGKYI